MTIAEIKDLIYRNGFLTESQIRLRIKDYKSAIKEIKQDTNIHEVKYTNTYVNGIAVKKLYIFNPAKKKRVRKK